MSAHTGLINVLNTVSALRAVYGYMPAALNGDRMPCAAIHMGPASHQWQAVDYARTEREWHIYIIAGAVGQSTLAAHADSLRSLTAAVVSALLADPTLGGHIDHISAMQDEGLGVHQIAGSDFLGVLLRVSCVEKWSV